jgi:hypothetical protein
LRLPVAETTVVAEIGAEVTEDGVEDNTSKITDADLPAYLTNGEDEEEASINPSDDGEHLEAAE